FLLGDSHPYYCHRGNTPFKGVHFRVNGSEWGFSRSMLLQIGLLCPYGAGIQSYVFKRLTEIDTLIAAHMTEV
ncbi:MAG: hypothetical protein KKC72_16815, partial [Alphaproteobacteria bacterium]|nr:hypothetical protein [Alphaproteobacteria bacterium]MBU1837970.1 hypothetical protein [Alphaproteobacteria bacterium]